eukprot:COSAG05_NODE_9803_length_600_cov_1.215569_1_plen_156_part_10
MARVVAHCADMQVASASSISPRLISPSDPVAEKLTVNLALLTALSPGCSWLNWPCTRQEDAKDILLASLHAADPRVGIMKSVTLSSDGQTLTVSGRAYALGDYDEVIVVGAGKASAQMAATIVEILGDRVTGGHVVTKYEHTNGAATGPISVTEAA